MKKSITLRRAIVTLEDIIKNSVFYPTEKELIDKAANRMGVTVKSAQAALEWLLNNNKIIIDTNDNTIVWVAVDNSKLRKLLRESKPVLRRE